MTGTKHVSIHKYSVSFDVYMQMSYLTAEERDELIKEVGSDIAGFEKEDLEEKLEHAKSFLKALSLADGPCLLCDQVKPIEQWVTGRCSFGGCFGEVARVFCACKECHESCGEAYKDKMGQAAIEYFVHVIQNGYDDEDEKDEEDEDNQGQLVGPPFHMRVGIISDAEGLIREMEGSDDPSKVIRSKIFKEVFLAKKLPCVLCGSNESGGRAICFLSPIAGNQNDRCFEIPVRFCYACVAAQGTEFANRLASKVATLWSSIDLSSPESSEEILVDIRKAIDKIQDTPDGGESDES